MNTKIYNNTLSVLYKKTKQWKLNDRTQSIKFLHIEIVSKHVKMIASAVSNVSHWQSVAL